MFKAVSKCAIGLCSAIFLFTAAPALAAEINWQQTYSEALAVSKNENKPIMVIFTADWCVFCKKLENQTFTNPQIIREINNNFVAVKIDKDKNGQIAKDFNVQGIPDMFFLTPFNTESGVQTIARQLGFIEAKDLLPGLQQIAAKYAQ